MTPLRPRGFRLRFATPDESQGRQKTPLRPSGFRLRFAMPDESQGRQRTEGGSYKGKKEVAVVKTEILKKKQPQITPVSPRRRAEAGQITRIKSDSRKGGGFTLVELLVVIAIIALLMAVLLPALNKARRVAKRVVCMSDMKQLVMAWAAYADNSDGKLVNGGQTPPQGMTGSIVTEPCWCTSYHNPPSDPGYDWNLGVIDGVQYYTWGMTSYQELTYEQRVEKLKKGALYRYVQNPKVYRCPEAMKIVHRTYVMANSMNAHNSVAPPNQEGTVFKRTGEIKKSSQKLVFIEEKITTPDAMQIRADAPQWEPYPDWPGLMHENGTTVGMADGHCDYWRWQCQETIALAALKGLPPNISTYTNPSCKKDIVKVQVAVWGDSLKYPPSPADMP